MLFNIITYNFYISGIYFWFLEIKVKGFLWKCVKRASIFGDNHWAEKNCPLMKDIGHFWQKKTLRCYLRLLNPSHDKIVNPIRVCPHMIFVQKNPNWNLIKFLLCSTSKICPTFSKKVLIILLSFLAFLFDSVDQICNSSYILCYILVCNSSHIFICNSSHIFICNSSYM